MEIHGNSAKKRITTQLMEVNANQIHFTYYFIMVGGMIGQDGSGLTLISPGPEILRIVMSR